MCEVYFMEHAEVFITTKMFQCICILAGWVRARIEKYPFHVLLDLPDIGVSHFS